MTATTSLNPLASRLARHAAATIAAALLVLAMAIPAAARAAQTGSGAGHNAAHASRSHHLSKVTRHRRHLARQRRRARIRARRARAQARRARRASNQAVASNSAVTRPKVNTKAASPAPTTDVIDAGFEEGLANWNTAGVGEETPTVVDDTARSGTRSGKVTLTGSEDRSELILGGNGGGSTNGMAEFDEGAEYWYGFSFEIDQMVYGHPGAHNLIMQFKGDDEGSPAFGLQLWDYEGDDGEYADDPKGLWSHGPAMDGDRFLAPVSEHEWHDIAIHFKASSVGAGFYEVFLDGQPIDSRSGVSMIAEGASFAYIKDGLYRNGGEIPGTSEIHLDAARLGHSLADIVPG
jgi:hypothetical protein